MNNPQYEWGYVQRLENITVTNGVGLIAGQTIDTFTKGVFVPAWATKAVFTIFYDSATGTSPLFDFVLGVADWGTEGTFTDATDVASFGDAAWNGITQVTGAGPYQIAVEVGPDVTDDDTGSATASCWYKVKGELPPVLTYTMTIDTTTNDEDYGIRLAVMWR
jgi:hypothetical protein